MCRFWVCCAQCASDWPTAAQFDGAVEPLTRDEWLAVRWLLGLGVRINTTIPSYRHNSAQLLCFSCNVNKS